LRWGLLYHRLSGLFPELAPLIRGRRVLGTIYQSPEILGRLAFRALYSYLQGGVLPPPVIGITPQLILPSNLDFFLRSLSEGLQLRKRQPVTPDRESGRHESKKFR
jgi:hypothetical protein